MLQNVYLGRIRELIDDLETKSGEAIDAAAEMITESLVAGGGFFISPLGHGNAEDMFHRAGGLVCVQPFDYSSTVRDHIANIDEPGGTNRSREHEEPFDQLAEAARFAVRSSRMRRGDCLIVGSVSGRGTRTIAMTRAAQEIGVKVIGITSVNYAKDVKPDAEAVSLHEVCDFIIDSNVPYGDAAIDVDGLDERIVPISGVTSILICWMIQIGIAEKLIARGLKPSHYISGNRPDGPDFNAAMQKQYNEQGY